MELNLQTALDDARQAALKAWKKIAHFTGEAYEIYPKGGDEGPATEADLLAERTILEYLMPRYPESEFGYLTEEAPPADERLAKKYCWVIDPIDGTHEFIEGVGDYAIHIGLAGRPEGSDASVALAGIVYVPADGRIFEAVKGGGAFLRHLEDDTVDRLQIPAPPALKDSRLIVTRSNMSQRTKAAIDHLGVTDLLQRGSVGVKVGEVARGASHLYVNVARRNCREWDVCAPDIIIREAGGLLTNALGLEMAYNRADCRVENGLLAGHPALVREAAARLKELEWLWMEDN